ncbi:MAG TPA: GIY-YIG nuclease family protein [Candidatus Paceibacterota bacterium]|nr:GIY-YIG nuclease family protein [Candidatus Paceibacterota bacterium]
MKIKDLKKNNLPDKPGVYFFKKGKDILYIGKATSLKSRVRSYFSKDLINTRGPMILDMVTLADNIVWQETDSVLEALIAEANLIKKYQPKYNTKEKDNKSFNYVCLTKEDLPRVLIERERLLEKDKYQAVYGPFPKGGELKEALGIIRRIFPFLDNDSVKKNNKQFYDQLKLNPSSQIEYKKNIKHLKLFFQGKKKSILSSLKKEMMKKALEQKFEQASEIKRKIFALEHINDISLIKKESLSYQNGFRVEAYDIAHMSGLNMVGVMVVLENGQPSKKEYRKFIIRTRSKADDIGALREVLERRLKHIDWPLPSLIVLDGGLAQKNIGEKVLKENKIKIPIISVVKDERHKPKVILGERSLSHKYKELILIANSESHRFAINFHTKKRNQKFLK